MTAVTDPTRRPFRGPLSRRGVLALAAGAAATPALAQVEIDINEGQRAALPIAIPAFTGADARTQALGADVSRIAMADLERSGAFRAMPESAYPERNLDVTLAPKLDAWRAAGAQALVNGRASVDGDGRLRVDFRLWDTGANQQLLGMQFASTSDNQRRVAHRIADAVYKRLTGEDGYFDTRIAFVGVSGPKSQRIRRLAIMDQDGANPSFIETAPGQVLTPRFSASGQELTFTLLRADGTRVYLLNIESNRREALGDFPGMVYAPRFAPNGQTVALAVQGNGDSDIYALDLATRKTRRLTNDPAIDTSPSYSPDGAKIVFNSDRGGSPQLYVMSAEGGAARRISFGSGRYTAPVWSPKGDLIAFVRQQGSSFHIGVMSPDGHGEKTLTTSSLDESPTFAPNGRVIMFSRETPGGLPRLWTVDVAGRAARPAPYAGAGSDPAWSPLLK